MTSESIIVTKAIPAVGRLGSVGLLLFGLAALVIASSFAFHIVHPTLKPIVSPPEQHDFQLVQLGDLRRDQFLVDKRTGRVWQSVCSGKASGSDCDAMIIWDEMYVSSVTPSDTDVVNAYLTQQARK